MAIDVKKKQAKIRFNYNEAMARAKELEEIAGDLKRVQDELEDALQPLRSGWTGESAERYSRKGALLGAQIDKSAREAKATADDIRKIANKVMRIEMANLQLAINRGS